MAPTMTRGDPGLASESEGLPHFREVSSFPGPWLRGVLADPTGHFTASLRSKRFRLVSEQKKDRGRGFSVLTAREMKGEPKNEGGERGFFPTPAPLFHLRHFFARSLTYCCSSFFGPKPHRNAFETLATQAFLRPVQNCLFCGFSQKIWFFA